MKSCLLFLLALLCSVLLFAQPAALVPFPFPGVTPGFHQTHTGQILFSSTAIPVDGYPGTAYIGLRTNDSFTLPHPFLPTPRTVRAFAR